MAGQILPPCVGQLLACPLAHLLLALLASLELFGHWQMGISSPGSGASDLLGEGQHGLRLCSGGAAWGWGRSGGLWRT